MKMDSGTILTHRYKHRSGVKPRRHYAPCERFGSRHRVPRTLATPPLTGPGESTLAAPLRAEIEGWFVRRGVPQLIEDYTAERRMDARAGPFLVAWLVVGSVLWWGTRPNSSLLANTAGVLIMLLAIALAIATVRRFRGQIMWWVDRRLGALDIFAIGAAIAVASSVIKGSWAVGAISGLNSLAGIGLIYAVIGLGLGEIGWWSIRRLRQELLHIVGLLARTLPMLLILVLFLLFAAELWEAAHHLSPGEQVAVVLLLTGVAALLVLTAFRSEMSAIEAATWEELRVLTSDTPVEPLATEVPAGPVPPLRVLQRLNLNALVLIAQLIQSVFVATVVAGFLVVFGILVLPTALQERWIGEAVSAIGRFEFLGEIRTLSSELVVVAVLLGSVVGLYFTGLSITDSAYRTAHFERILDEVRQLMAARAYYALAMTDK